MTYAAVRERESLLVSPVGGCQCCCVAAFLTVALRVPVPAASGIQRTSRGCGGTAAAGLLLHNICRLGGSAGGDFGAAIRGRYAAW